MKQSMSDEAILAISRDAIRMAMEHMEFNETHIRETINAVLGLSVSSTTSNKKTKKERKPYVASNKVKAQQAFVKKHNKEVRTELEKLESFSCTNSKGETKIFWENEEGRTIAKLSAATTSKCSQMWNSLSDKEKNELIEEFNTPSSDESSTDVSDNEDN